MTSDPTLWTRASVTVQLQITSDTNGNLDGEVHLQIEYAR